MTDPFSVSAHERGVVRVFTTDFDAEGNAAITRENVARLLGSGLDLDPARIEVFPSSRLDPMTLSEYLREGYGIPAADLAGKASALDALKGLVILVASSAFRGKSAELDPKNGIRLVGAFSEPGMQPPKPMLPAEGPEVTLQQRGATALPSGGRKPGSTLALAALILAAVIILALVL